VKIALIPARAGSKRIPNKNVKEFFGVPMVARAINLLQNSKIFELIEVSTDDLYIAELSSKLGASVVKRSSYLSSDEIGINSVMSDYCKQNTLKFKDTDQVVCLLPCTPLISVEDIIKFSKLHDSNIDSFVFPVAEYASNPDRALVRTQSSNFKFKIEENRLKSEIHLKKYFYDAGQFYIQTAKNWKQGLASNIVCDVIEPWKAIDIDEPMDWDFAEIIFKGLNSNQTLKSTL
jgi:CMP-N-acetylneuraminic acid synthetase